MSSRRKAPISYARYYLFLDNVVPTSFFPALILLLTIVAVPPTVTRATSGPRFVYTLCSNDTAAGGTYAPNSLFQSNLDSLLFDVFLSSNSTYNANDVGVSQEDVVHGLYYCRGDVGPNGCHACIQAAALRVVQDCPTAKEAVIWYDACTLRYANRPFPPPEDENFWVTDQAPASSSVDFASRGGSELFDRLVGELSDDSTDDTSSSPLRFYRWGRARVKSTLSLEMTVQCSPQINESACEACLRASVGVIPSCCGWRREWVMIFRTNCEVEYRFIDTAAGNDDDDDDNEDEDEDDDDDQDDDRDSPRERRRRRRQRARVKWRILRDFAISTAGATASIGFSGVVVLTYRKLRASYPLSNSCNHHHTETPPEQTDDPGNDPDIKPGDDPEEKITSPCPIKFPPIECPPCNPPCPAFYACEIPCQQYIQWHNPYYG